MKHKEYRKLHAEWYEYMSGGKGPSEEIDFWARHIQAAGEPVLELGGGTGKFLCRCWRGVLTSPASIHPRT